MCTMVECKPLKHCWLEVHEQNFRRDQLGLKRTLNMRQDQVCLAITSLLMEMPLYRHWWKDQLKILSKSWTRTN